MSPGETPGSTVDASPGSEPRRRVVLVINDLRRAGAETQLVLLATGLDRSRYDVSIVILKTQNDFATELAAAGVPVISLGKQSRWDLLVVWRLYRHLRRAQPDVVHSYLFFANLVTVIAARAASIPVVILSQRSSYEATLSPFWRRVARWAHCRADQVLVNSEAARREEIAAGFPAERIKYVPNGAPITDPGVVAHRADLGLPNGPLVVCVAQFAPEKGHADLIAAWPGVRAACPDAILALVGDGPLRADLEAEAVRLGVSKSILFLGFRHPTAPYLAAADVVVQPSRTEGMPNAVLEAMALGKPIVATRVGGAPELIEQDVSGRLTAPRDPLSLGVGLSAFLSDGERALRTGAAARWRAANSFSIAGMVAATEAAYTVACRPQTEGL
jgi:glycosyltransferase involved in cell wall biosynthesis